MSSALVMPLSVLLSVLSVLYVFLFFLIIFNLLLCYCYSFLFSFLLLIPPSAFSTLLSDPCSVLSLSVHSLLLWSPLLCLNLIFFIFSFPITVFFLFLSFVLFLLNLFSSLTQSVQFFLSPLSILFSFYCSWICFL